MELLHTYPVAFIVTVVLPLITGIVLSVGGYESLKARSESDAQLTRIETNTETALNNLPDINQTIQTMNRYEQALSELGQKDEALTAVLSQYQKMNLATQKMEQMRGTEDIKEKYGLASEVLDILSSNLAAVSVRDDLPSHPLIIALGENSFRVLFSVPMRIPPQLEFQGIPEGSQAHVLEKSKYGFTVSFEPINIPVTNFGFSASAEL